MNLQGWQLQYGAGPTTWTFPAVLLGPCESRVIFCDGNSATDPMQELHTNFNLSKSGKNLVLLDNTSDTVSVLHALPGVDLGRFLRRGRDGDGDGPGGRAGPRRSTTCRRSC